MNDSWQQYQLFDDFFIGGVNVKQQISFAAYKLS